MSLSHTHTINDHLQYGSQQPQITFNLNPYSENTPLLKFVAHNITLGKMNKSGEVCPASYALHAFPSVNPYPHFTGSKVCLHTAQFTNFQLIMMSRKFFPDTFLKLLQVELCQSCCSSTYQEYLMSLITSLMLSTNTDTFSNFIPRLKTTNRSIRHLAHGRY